MGIILPPYIELKIYYPYPVLLLSLVSIYFYGIKVYANALSNLRNRVYSMDTIIMFGSIASFVLGTL